MRPSLRFLAATVIGWAGLRAATLGAIPGAQLFHLGPSEPPPPPVAATQFPPVEPIAPAPAEAAPLLAAAASYDPPRSGAPSPVPAQIQYAAALPSGDLPPPRRAALKGVLPEPEPQFYAPISTLDEWPLSRIASAARSPLRSSIVAPAQSTPAAFSAQGIDRIQLSAWALLRSQNARVAGSRSLAPNGSLGASQAGARMSYNLTRQIAGVFRASSEVSRRGGEVAAGVRIQPIAGIPVWIDAERRQRVGRYGGGRSAFALFFEGGVYDRPMPARFSLNAYLQGGIVGFRRRDKFIDGALTLTRPVYRRFSAGLGVWGGAQPGIYRVDVGPRLTMRVRSNVRVHLDYRRRIAGNALPDSGPAVALAGDF